MSQLGNSFSIKRLKATGATALAVALAASLFVGPLPAAAASMTITSGVATMSDISAPVLLGSSVSPLSHNMADGPVEITIRTTISDATGTEAPVVSVSHDSGQSYGFGRMTLVSGSSKNGVWERKVVIPEGAASGAWEVSLFPLSDTLGNDGTGFRTLGTVLISDQIQLKDLTASVPTITGNAVVGSRLLANAGAWSPSSVALKYQWKRDGVSIAGATSEAYQLVAADAGRKITVTVTGSKSGYKSVSKTSASKKVKK